MARPRKDANGATQPDNQSDGTEDTEATDNVPEVTPPPQKVEVAVDVLKAIQSKLDAQQSELELLRKAADKNAIARHTPKDSIRRSVKVATVDGKLVTSWKLLTNVATYRQGVENVDQKGQFTLEDGETIPYSIQEFRDMIEPVEVEIDLSKTTFEYDKDGNRRAMKTVVFGWHGKEVTLSTTFVNP